MPVVAALAAASLVLGFGFHRPAYAFPNAEKITFDNALADTGAFAAAMFTPFDFMLLANRTSGTVSFFDLQTMSALQDPADGTPVIFPVVADPVAIATYVDNPGNPTVAYAFVAGYSSNKVSVIDLMAFPPVVLGGSEINLVTGADTSNPGPVALLQVSGRLFVAAGSEGTILQYDLGPLPAVPTHVTVAAGSQVSAKGNLVPCVVSTNPTASSARPRVMTDFGSVHYVGCSQGTISSFSSAGMIATRGDLAGGFNIESVRGLAGDPRAGTDILYVLDDTGDALFALNVAAGVFDSTTNLPADVIIQSVCSAGSVNRNSVPLPPSGAATALFSFADASAAGGGNFAGVLTATSSTASLQLIDLARIDTDPVTVPICGAGENGTIVNQVSLTQSKPFLNGAGNVPAGIGQQVFYWLGYVGIPGYSSTGGTAALTLVTDNPLLRVESVTELALTSASTTVGTLTLGNATTTIVWSSDKSVQPAAPGNVAPTVSVRKKRAPNPRTGLPALVTTTSNLDQALQVVVTSSNLINSGVVTATSNEFLEVLVTGDDQDRNKGYSAQEVIFDTTPPTMPALPGAVSVEIGDTILAVRVAGAADPQANDVRSGLGGFAVHFTAPTPGVPADRFYPAANGRFTLTGLTNNVTYGFDIYAVDAAGNVSATLLSASGTPVPGLGIIALTGEQGCGLSREGGQASLLGIGALGFLWFLRRGRPGRRAP